MPREPVSRRLHAVAGVLANDDLRRLTLAWGCFFLIDTTSLIGLSVWAFEDGGADAVGVIGLARLLPSAVALPFGAWAADRFARRLVAIAVFAAEALALLCLIVAISVDPPLIVVAALVAVVGVAVAPYRPAHLAMAPLVAHSPEQLVAANVAGGAIEGVAILAGPLIAAAVLTAAAPEVVLIVSMTASVLGLIAVAGVRPGSDPSAAMRRHRVKPAAAVLGGFTALWHAPSQGLIVGCFVIQLLVRGLLSVQLVLISFDMFDLGGSGVGWLSSAIGVGALMGAAVTSGLTGRRRLAGPFAIGLVLWGAPIIVLALAHHVAIAAVALVVIGVGNSVLDVAGFTLLQRMGDDKQLGRVFGVLFTVGAALSGLGAVLAPALVDWVGLRWSLAITGLVLPATSLLALARLRSIDLRNQPDPDVIDALLDIELLNVLAPVTIEKLATSSTIVEHPAGRAVVIEGQIADSFYVILQGSADVTRESVQLTTLKAGDYFGEIALLTNVTRTATVRCGQSTRLLVLPGSAFLDAVCGNAQAFTATSTVVDARLATG
jgi:MFS family permease